MSKTKNIGQVVGLFIGTTPPSNTTLIWFDETPNQCCHKVYNPTTKLWQALNPDIISITTYSELVNNAKKNGLSIGKQYQIRDKSDILATAITPTKLQYVDNLGNILIDDLGTNIQYHVSSSNILIDDVHGVLNSSNQLVFSFNEETPNFNTDYILGKLRSGNIWKLAKFSLKNLLSTSIGNSISWKSGFFFNFSEAIKGILDKSGGIVGKNTYDLKIKQLETSINNASKENQQIKDNVSQKITEATTNEKIYDKELPINIDTTIAPGDIQKGDRLSTIISKIQRWINKFKYATGIKISQNFADAKKEEFVNNNDTVESALGKIQYRLKNISTITTLKGVEKLSEEYHDWGLDQSDFVPKDDNNILEAFALLHEFIKNIAFYTRLSTDFDYDLDDDALPEIGDSIELSIQKLSAWLYNAIATIRFRSPYAKYIYDNIKSVKHIYETDNNVNDALSSLLAQLDYNQFHINKEMLNNNIIDYSKLAKKGVLPTEFFTIRISTAFLDLKLLEGIYFGGVISKGADNGIFKDNNNILSAPSYSFNDIDFDTILSFIPFTKSVSSMEAENCSSLIYSEEDMTYQFLLYLTKDKINEITSNGYNYLEISYRIYLYGNYYEDSNHSLSINLLQTNHKVRGGSIRKSALQNISKKNRNISLEISLSLS